MTCGVTAVGKGREAPLEEEEGEAMVISGTNEY